RLTRTAAFFKGAQVTLNMDNPLLTVEDLQEIDRTLKRHEISLRKVRPAAQDSQLASAALALGALVVPSGDPPPAEGKPDAEASSSQAEPDESELPALSRREVATAKAKEARLDAAPPSEAEARDEQVFAALIIRRTLRSGMALRNEGPIVVIGDVNPGAEVIAGGDVIVWGKLRGLVHAGAMGNNEAVICALVFEPTQLRIGNLIARMSARQTRQPAPEIASIRDGKIEVVEWS
ncbi:MAG: septum site-determining protein MinC, partial [Chloroflexi bacterium]|nr:septum site-determining protein MinC [Chloroflexota bacterium]